MARSSTLCEQSVRKSVTDAVRPSEVLYFSNQYFFLNDFAKGGAKIYEEQSGIVPPDEHQDEELLCGAQ